MKAFRWILFCLVAFGLGTGVAFAMHPPTVGIPKSDAQDLATDLSKIRSYAAAGHCDAVRGRLASASKTIDNLPVTTNANTERQLSAALERVRTAAIAECQSAADANLPDTTETTPETTPTTPTPDAQTPTPTPSVEPTPTPAPDGTSPSSGGVGTDGTSPDPGADQGDQGDDTGGITLPNGVQVPSPNQVRQQLHDARKQIERALGQHR
ncbi:MAG: hypothetical protein AAGC46_14590 [Solirubrobacteraceae bacterium]|nr:hypothetical protein [Patulibacter sp.]